MDDGTDRERRDAARRTGAVSDTETSSLREEEGKSPFPTPAERMGEVPLAFSTGGVLGHGPEEPASEYELELDEARRREREGT